MRILGITGAIVDPPDTNDPRDFLKSGCNLKYRAVLAIWVVYLRYMNVARLLPPPHQPRLPFCAPFFTILSQFGAFLACFGRFSRIWA